MERNLIINLGFFLANIALVCLLLVPQGLAAMESDAAKDAGQPPPAQSAAIDHRDAVKIEYPQRNHTMIPIPQRGASARERPEPQGTGKGNTVLRSLPTTERVIALTFDDGPRSSLKKLLAILEEKEVPATFFLLGSHAQKRPALVRAIIQAGCEIANHTWSHPHLTRLSQEEMVSQVDSCAQAFAALGARAKPYLRPPYGDWDEGVRQVSEDLGYKLVLWNVDTRDWQYDDAEIVLGRALSGLKPGCIVLFHDGPRVTLEVLPRFIDEARARGYKFVLISDYIE